MYLRDMAKKPVSEREALVTDIAFVLPFLVMYGHDVLVEITSFFECTPAFPTFIRLRT